MLIHIISNRRNNVNKKGNDLFLNGRLTQYKVKEYTFEYTDKGSTTEFVINEKDASLDGDSYLLRADGARLPINMYVNSTSYSVGYINENGNLNFTATYNVGTLHVFVRYI